MTTAPSRSSTLVWTYLFKCSNERITRGKARIDGACLKFQGSEGWGGRIAKNSKQAEATWQNLISQNSHFLTEFQS